VPPDRIFGGLLRDIGVEDQQRQRRGQLRLAVRYLPPSVVGPMVTNIPGAGGTLPKTICNATRSRYGYVVRDYFAWFV
jgi:hypothetical protein